MSASSASSLPLASRLPPLILGTATFNSLYNTDPYALPTTAIVHRALALGIRAFDTSPYYGPAESLLGAALSCIPPSNALPRKDLFLLTKCGREGASSFDYSPAWVRQSVSRSLERLRTTYLDVVYCHDVEFVTPAEVLAAVQTLRELRTEPGHTVRFVGISGYPLPLLCELAELVFERTGEPLDVVMSYCHFTLQNVALATQGLERLREAGVGVVINASLLAMGLLREKGVPEGSLGDWHPAPTALRGKCREVAEWCKGEGERLEVLALRWALGEWALAGREAGGYGPMIGGQKGIVGAGTEDEPGHGSKVGVSVIGVSYLEELEETMREWDGAVDGLGAEEQDGGLESRKEESLRRMKEVRERGAVVQRMLGEWRDYSWKSPPEDYKR